MKDLCGESFLDWKNTQNDLSKLTFQDIWKEAWNEAIKQADLKLWEKRDTLEYVNRDKEICAIDTVNELGFIIRKLISK
jgi:Fe-S cluster biosynthesis and repair protein YggX